MALAVAALTLASVRGSGAFAGLAFFGILAGGAAGGAAGAGAAAGASLAAGAGGAASAISAQAGAGAVCGAYQSPQVAQLASEAAKVAK